MAMPGALAICRGLNRKLLNIQEMTQMLPMGLVCLICFSFFGGWQRVVGFVWKLWDVMAASLIPMTVLHARLCSNGALDWTC